MRRIGVPGCFGKYALLLLALAAPVGTAGGAEAASRDAGAVAAAPEPQSVGKADAEADGELKSASLGGRNRTAEFRAKYRQEVSTLFGAKQRELLGRHRVILVPGFLTALYLQLSEVAKDTLAKEDFLDYLSSQNEALKELGLTDAQEFLDNKKFNTQGTVAANAQRIAQAVKSAAAAGKRVILISHSKGGNDTLAALLLLQNSGGLRAVAGWLSLQSGFFGSPVADEAMQRPVLRQAAKLFLAQADGSLDALSDSTSEKCRKFMEAHARGLRQLVKTVPILSFASWKDKPGDAQVMHPDSILFTTRNQMAEQGLKNDGLIPLKNAVLPGTNYVAAAGIDHAETVMNNPSPILPSRLDRKKLTTVLLAMLLEQIAKTAAPKGRESTPRAAP